MIFKILVALTLSVNAHNQYMDDEDPDAYLTNREVNLEEDFSTDYPTKIDTFEILHGFTNQGAGGYKKRANLIVTRKEKTGEIMQVSIDEADKLPDGVDESSFN